MEAVPEDRRLKALGLVVAGIGAIWLWHLAARAQDAWPLAAPAMADLAWRTALCVNLCAVALALLARGCGARSLWQPPPRRRAALLWWAMANAAIPLVIYGLMDAGDRVDTELARSGWAWLPQLIITATALLLWLLWRRSRRLVAPSATDAMRADTRAPLLYLRSFADDSNAMLDDYGWKGYEKVIAWVGLPTPEEEMARVLQCVGPVVAIGRPGEHLPLLGAARLYVTDAQWQAAVLALMHKAQLVVIRIGATPGVRWEIEHALQNVPRRRIVLAFQGPADPGRLDSEVQRQLAAVLGSDWAATLPEAPPRGWRGWLWRDPRRRMGSLVCFPDGLTPVPVPLRVWPLWGREMLQLMLLRLSAPPLHRAWRAVFQRLQIDAGSYGARHSRALAVVLAVLLGGFGAHWFYLERPRRGWTYVGLLICGSFVAGWWDALHFIWVDRARFDALAAAPSTPRKGSSAVAG